MGKQDDQNNLGFSEEEISDLAKELDRIEDGAAQQSGQPGGPRVVQVTHDKVVGAPTPKAHSEEPEEDLDGATVIMKRPVFSTDPTFDAPAVTPLPAPAPDPSIDTAPDWAKVIGNPEDGKTIEMPVPATLQGPSAAGPGQEGWVDPAEPFDLEDDGMGTQQDVPPPGAESSGDQRMDGEGPPNRMAILMAALGKSAMAKQKAAVGTARRRTPVRTIRPVHSAPPSMRGDRSNPAVPVEPIEPAAPVEPAAPAVAEQDVDERPTAPQASVPAGMSPPEAAQLEEVPPLVDDEEDRTIPPPLSVAPSELEATDLRQPTPATAKVEIPAPVARESVQEPTLPPPPVEEPLARAYFDPDQPSPFERVAMEEASAEMEVDIDLDLDPDEEDDEEIPFFTEEPSPSRPTQLLPGTAQEAPAPEEDPTPPPIPTPEESPFVPSAVKDLAGTGEDEILTSAPPLGQDPAPPSMAEAEPDHAEELDLEDMEEASLEELEEETLAPPLEPVSPEPPPPLMPDAPAPQARPMTPARGRPWYYDLFDQDWLKTNPSPPLEETEKEVQFILESLGVTQQSTILELGVGDGRHLLEVARRGFSITSYEMSLPLILRAAEISHRFNIKARYIQGDYRDLGMDECFDAVYCVGTRFGFYDEDSNERIVNSVNRALRPGGRFLLDVINRDYLLEDLPARIWRDGEDCLVLEEVEFDYFTSRLISRRTVAFEDGRHTEQEVSVRVFSLHEIGKLLHRSGFRVLEVSGHTDHRGYFFGNQSTSMVLLAEKRS